MGGYKSVSRWGGGLMEMSDCPVHPFRRLGAPWLMAATAHAHPYSLVKRKMQSLKLAKIYILFLNKYKRSFLTSFYLE